MKKIVFVIFAFSAMCSVAKAEEPFQIAFNFNFGFQFGQSKKIVAEPIDSEAPFYILLENGDRLLAENGDLVEKEHI